MDHTFYSLDRTFSALADPTRRAILSGLAEGERTVGDLAEPFNMSLPAVSKHIRVLEEAGLLERRHEGRIHRLSLNPDPMRGAAEWIDLYKSFWTSKLDQLEKLLEEEISGTDDDTLRPGESTP